MTTPLRINIPSVTHQTIEGEVIILNLDNGYYYSLLGTGAQIWQVCNGLTAEAIVAKTVEHFQGDRQELAQQTREFLQELQDEGLLVSSAVQTTSAATIEGSHEWVAPKLEKFTEMSDLLLIDPIHDVDAAGWPHVTTKTTQPAQPQ